MAGKQLDIGAGAVHLVRLSRMDGFFLNRLDAKSLQLLIEYLAEIHDYRLVNLLPQVSSEDLDQRNLQSWNLSMQEDTRQVKLNLETNIHVGSVDCR